MQSTVTNFTYAAADLAAGAMSNPVFRPDLHDGAVAVLEGLLENEPEERVALEAAGSAAALGSKYTGKVSISESNRRWFAEHGTYGTGGTDAD